MRIVLDAMGSDDFPGPEVQAAVEAARQFGDEIILVGPEAKLQPMLAALPGGREAAVRIVDATDVITMEDKGLALVFFHCVDVRAAAGTADPVDDQNLEARCNAGKSPHMPARSIPGGHSRDCCHGHIGARPGAIQLRTLFELTMMGRALLVVIGDGGD